MSITQGMDVLAKTGYSGWLYAGVPAYKTEIWALLSTTIRSR